MDTTTYSAFADNHLICTGSLKSMLSAVKARIDTGESGRILIFEDESGKQVDYDFRGTIAEILARELPAPKTGPGRPSLGVVCGEVSLMPRHWDWLEKQQHNVSATIRRLVDEAIRNEPDAAKARAAIEATDKELWALAGNLPSCEEASRSLYARDLVAFRSFMEEWPADIAKHLSALASRSGIE